MNVYYFFLVVIWAAAAVDVFIKLLEKGVTNKLRCSRYNLNTTQKQYMVQHDSLTKMNILRTIDKLAKTILISE